MPNQTVPGNATPAAKQGADAATTESASNLAALMGFKELTTEPSAGAADAANEHNSQQPEAGPVDSDLSQLETASDGADGEAEGDKLKAETPDADTDSDPEAGAEETAERKPDAAEPDGEDVLEEWLATLPKGAARKLRAQHRQLRAQDRQIAELMRELAETKAKQPEAKAEAQVSESAPVVIDNRLEHISDLRELETVEAKSRAEAKLASNVIKEVSRLRKQLSGDMDLDIPGDVDGVVRTLKSRGFNVEADRRAVAQALLDIESRAEKLLDEHEPLLEAAPRRRAYLQQEAQVLEAAAVDYPWLKTREGEDWQLFEQVVKGRPQVKLLGPDWPAIVAVQIEGHKALNARRAAKAKAAPVAAKAAAAPPKQPSRSAPPRPAAGSAARSRFEQSGKTEDLAALMPA